MAVPGLMYYCFFAKVEDQHRALAAGGASGGRCEARPIDNVRAVWYFAPVKDRRHWVRLFCAMGVTLTVGLLFPLLPGMFPRPPLLTARSLPHEVSVVLP